jgi:SWIM zinc finger
VPAEIITVGFCPQYWSYWKVQGSKDAVYDVTLNGAESMPHCTCKAFEFAPEDGKDCKHIRKVWEHGCLYNPQWKDAGPNDYEQHGIKLIETDRAMWPQDCPGCGQQMIAVKVAV